LPFQQQNLKKSFFECPEPGFRGENGVDSLRASLKGRSRRKKAHFFYFQTWNFFEYLEPRHLGAYQGIRVFRRTLRPAVFQAATRRVGKRTESPSHVRG
jgi:hypothetical protein